MRYILLFILFFNGYGISFSQENSSIYIHTDRDFYFPGDTVWFKGYIIDNGFLAENTFNLYLKFAHEDGKEYQQSVAMVSKGITASHFVIPLDYQGQELFLNAYTQNKNCPTSYFKKIGILQFDTDSLSSASTHSSSLDKNFNISIHPEGGILLGGIDNQLIIQCHDQLGYPAIAKGNLVNEQNQIIQKFETDAVGFAQIRFAPLVDTQYRIDWIGEDGQERKDNVQRAVLGSKASIIAEVDKTMIQLISNLPDQEVNVIANLGKRKLFQQNLKLVQDRKLSIPLQNKDLEYGILQVIVKDKNGLTLSKRSHLLGEKNMLLEPLVVLQSGSGEKSGNKLEIKLPDGEESASLSISVTDVDVPIDSSSNILTDLYLQPMASKNLIQPYLLWEKSKDKDLFIQMQQWNDAICPTNEAINQDTLLILKGQIKMDKNRWSKFYKNYQDIQKKEKKSRGASFGYQDFTSLTMKYLEIEFDSLGLFQIPNLIVFDSMDTKFVQIYRKLKFEPFHIQYQFANYNQVGRPFYIPKDYVSFVQPNEWKNKKWGFNSAFTIDATGKRVLQTVVINRTRTQREIDRLERRFYTAGVPTNIKPDQILTPLLDSLVIKRSQTLEDYLFSNIRRKSYEVFLNGRYIRELSPDSISRINADKFYGDEIAFLNEDVSNFPYIKYYSSFPLAKGGPAVLIYQYAPEEVDKELGKQLDEQTIMGYMSVKQYHPLTYETVAKKFSSGYDNRATLYWNPFVEIQAGQSSGLYTFFNNSKAKGYYLTIQGITRTGKIIYYRKLFK